MNVQATNITTTVTPGKYNYGSSCARPFVTRFKIKTINLLYWLSLIPINRWENLLSMRDNAHEMCVDFAGRRNVNFTNNQNKSCRF